MTREEGKQKLQWLSYGFKNGNTQTQINKRNLQWKALSKEEQAEKTKKLKPLKWLLQKYVNVPKGIEGVSLQHQFPWCAVTSFSHCDTVLPGAS